MTEAFSMCRIILLFIFIPFFSFSQDTLFYADYSRSKLVFVKRPQYRTFLNFLASKKIKAPNRVFVEAATRDEVFKGKLKLVNFTKISIDDKNIYLKDIENIRIDHRGYNATRSVFLGIAFTYSALLTTAIIYNEIEYGTSVDNYIFIPAIAASLALSAITLKFMLRNIRKCHNLEMKQWGWRVE